MGPLTIPETSRPAATPLLRALPVTALVCACSILLPVAVTCLGAATPELLDRIVAVIDEEIILWSELNLRVSMELQQEKRAMYITPAEVDERRVSTLDAMIDEQVVVLKAEKDSVEIDPTQVEELLGSEISLIKSRLGDDEFVEMLERSGLSERQLKKRYRKQIRHQLLYDRMLTQLAYRSFISRRDIDAYRTAYADSLPPKISISQINIKVRPREEVLEAASDRIRNIQGMLEAGEDFADVARRHSEDPGTARDGGDLGCFERGLLMREFEDAAFELRPGETSEPVLTEHGYHLILLHEKRESELCASHILVRAAITQDDRERANTQLLELRERTLSGEDFAQLAREYSEDALSAQKGGLLQVLERSQIPDFLLPHIDHLRLGEVSQPFLLEDGGHIIKINDDISTLESLVREERLKSTMRDVIEQFKLEIHVEKRLEDDFGQRPLDLHDRAQSGDLGDPSS